MTTLSRRLGDTISANWAWMALANRQASKGIKCRSTPLFTHFPIGATRRKGNHRWDLIGRSFLLGAFVVDVELEYD